MGGMPSVSASSSASNGPFSGGSAGWDQGPWTVNQSGSGAAAQSATGGLSPWMIAAGLAVAVWLVIR